MGVKTCSRPDCEKIMCDTYIDSVGYMCNECISEFKEYCEVLENTPTTEGSIERELKDFMKTPKDTYKEGTKISVDEFFNKHTK
jgi:hypothetical protein